jgi:hypothetical protein
MKVMKTMKEREFSDLSKKGISYAIEVYKTLGAGLLESAIEKTKRNFFMTFLFFMVKITLY